VRINFQNRFITLLFGTAWAVAVGVGLCVVLNYETAAGSVGAVPQTWPRASAIHPSKERMTLVMLAHPRCPCTRATIGELAQIMAEAQGKVDAYVLFFRPKEAGADWDQTDLRRSAAAIPGVTVKSDIEGAEARRFGGETSGHTLLFAQDGKLLFSGGITESRGHSGGNNGESAITAYIAHQPTDNHGTPVFGCQISIHATTAPAIACTK
jgi:hypothetical protein